MKYASWEDRRGAQDPPAGVPALVGRVLRARGITEESEAREFLRTDVGLLRDPMGLKDMDRAVARLERALEQGEVIAIYGDYDVDGVTATCLLYDFLKKRGGKVLWHIPRRLEDGYGLNCRGLDAVKERGAQVVVTVDCGITAVDEVEYAKSLGLEVIITDHHACKDLLPRAVAVVDPHRPDCPYPFKGLAGVGVAMKLAMAMGCPFEGCAGLAALGTVADVMPLLDENRAIVAQGLERLNNTDRPGILALLEAAGAAETVTAVTLGYTLAPRLNAAGRLGVTEVAVELLLSESLEQAWPLAQELCELNRKRQALEGEIFSHCVRRVEREAVEDAAIVLAEEGWHQGVVGIVASRLTDRFQKPAFMISLQDGMGKGSCRSVDGVSVFDALQDAQDLLEGFGGHAMAAGFTVREENIPALRQRLNGWVAENRAAGEGPRLRVDVALEGPELLTEEEVEALDMLEPFGAGNPKPVFTLSRVTLLEMSRVGAEGKHMRLRLRSRGQRFQCIYFSCPREEWEFQCEDRADVAFAPQINDFRGKRSVQLVLQDVRPADPIEEAQRAVYKKYRAGESLSPAEASGLIPSRGEFEALWRCVRSQAPMTARSLLALGRQAVREAGAVENVCHALVGLEVFHERGLVLLRESRGECAVTVLPRGEKVKLEESPILIRLRMLAEES